MHPEHRVLSKHYYPIMARLIVRDGFGCVRCGGIKSLRVDHIFPVRRGGLTVHDNLQVLCNRCNVIKGSQVADYRPWPRGRLGYERPRHTKYGGLIVRAIAFSGPYYDAEVIDFTANETVTLLFFHEQRIRRVHLRDVYPPDLQHLV